MSANVKKNSAANTSRTAKNRCSISSRTPLSERITPAISAPTASDRSSQCAKALIPTTKPNTASRKNSSSSRESSRPIRAPSQCDAASEHGDEDQRLRRHSGGRPHAAAAGRDEAEHGRDRDVLEEEDREHEVGLVVGQPAEVGQRLDRDRARRDVDARGDDERGEAEAERRDADEEPEAGVDDEIGGAAEPDVPAAAHEPLDAELEAEEEEEEDEPDLGDEVGHLGGLHELDEARVVRPEDDPGEEVGGDRGEPEPARRRDRECRAARS